MTRLGRGDRQDAAAQPSLREPTRDRVLQHARTVGTKPASRDYQHAPPPTPAASLDKFNQLAMGFGLRTAMQIEPRLYRMTATLQPLGVGAVDACKLLKGYRSARLR